MIDEHGSLPPVAADFAGPCLIEVEIDDRPGRGRWWRPNQSGYTSVLTEAGIYTAEAARTLTVMNSTCYPVDAVQAFRIARDGLCRANEALNVWGKSLPSLP